MTTLREEIEGLADEFATNKEACRRNVETHAYAEGRRDAWDAAEAMVRDLLAEHPERAGHDTLREAIKRICTAAERNGLWSGIDPRDLRAVLAKGKGAEEAAS